MLLHKHYYDLCTDIEELRNRVRFLNEALETAINYVSDKDKEHLYWLLEHLSMDFHYQRRNYND
jgi:hypothetical protein